MVTLTQHSAGRRQAKSYFLVLLLLVLPNYLFAQQEITLNLADLQSAGKLTAISRGISLELEGTKRYIKVAGRLEEGVISPLLLVLSPTRRLLN